MEEYKRKQREKFEKTKMASHHEDTNRNSNLETNQDFNDFNIINVKVTRYLPRHKKYVEDVNYFKCLIFDLNPIFPIEIFLKSTCSKLQLKFNDCRLWYLCDDVLQKVPLDKTSGELGYKENDKFILEVKVNGVWPKDVDDNRMERLVGESNYFPSDQSSTPTPSPLQPSPSPFPTFNTHIPCEPHQQPYQQFDTHNQNRPLSIEEQQLQEVLKLSLQENQQEQNRYEHLEDQLVSRGLKIYRVKDDGNCLFRAVSVLLYGTEDQHIPIREKTVGFMGENRAQFEGFVSEDYDIYLAKMLCEGEYGTNIEIEAISQLFHRTVEIYSDECGAEPLNTFSGRGYEDSAPLRISYHRRNHYNAVIPIDNEENVIPYTGYGVVNERLKRDTSNIIDTSTCVSCPYCNDTCKDEDELQIHYVTNCPIYISMLGG